MNALGQNLASSFSGNIPKAILCVRKMPTQKMSAQDSWADTVNAAAGLQEELLAKTKMALEGSQTFGSLTKGGMMEDSGYFAIEVQYNPSSIHMETLAGRQVDYSGGNLGGKSINQQTEVTQPVSTTMSFQLIFDDMNPFDAFMLENLAPTTVGNTVSLAGGLKKMTTDDMAKGGYSVQTQVDGLMALLTQTETRQVIFFWAQMCFRGELTSVNTRYTMFNKDGNPIRGVADLTICQGEDPRFGYDTTYWDEAFSKAFGNEEENEVRGMADQWSRKLNNNFLNLNL